MRIPLSLTVILLATGLVFGQTPGPASNDAKLKSETDLKFDASDIRTSPRSANATVFMSGGLRGDRYGLRNATMLDLISTAYGKGRELVLGGPSWLEFDRFDIAAKVPKGTGQKDVGPMLKSLLAERFALKVHEDTKPMPAVVLTTGKGKPKLREAEASGAEASGQGNCKPGDPRPQQPGVTFMQEMHCRNVTMEAFANFLRGYGGPYFDQPVVNKTMIDGNFDIDLKFTPRQLLAQAGPDAINIYKAVEELGLKLETQSIPRPVLFVDSVLQKATPNTAEAANIPQREVLKEFEVAVIKPSQPDANPQLQVQPSGQVDLKGVPLKVMVAFVWGYDPFTDEMVVNAPKSMESQKWDITAKVSGTATKADAPQLDIDDIRSMLKTLIEERFSLKWHVEDRPVTAYTLTAAKPKMKRGDPAMRASWKEGPGPDGKDPRINTPVLSRLVAFQNISMAQFAEDLQRVANGYIHNSVLDETGLEGGYDFTLSFSPAGLLRSGGPGRGGDQPGTAAGPGAAGAAAASDPNGALSLFDAIKQQLGLKLEMQKRPLPVLVIDHVEEKPTEN